MFNIYQDNMNKFKDYFYEDKYFSYTSNDRKGSLANKIQMAVRAVKTDEEKVKYTSEHLCSVSDNNVYLDFVFSFKTNFLTSYFNITCNHNTFYGMDNSFSRNPTIYFPEMSINDKADKYNYYKGYDENFKQEQSFQCEEETFLNQYNKVANSKYVSLLFEKNQDKAVIDNHLFTGMLVFFTKDKDNNLKNYFINHTENIKEAKHNNYFSGSCLQWQNPEELNQCYDSSEKLITFNFTSEGIFGGTPETYLYSHNLFNCKNNKIKLIKRNGDIYPNLHKIVQHNKHIIPIIYEAQNNALMSFKIFTAKAINNVCKILQEKNSCIQDFMLK